MGTRYESFTWQLNHVNKPPTVAFPWMDVQHPVCRQSPSHIPQTSRGNTKGAERTHPHPFPIYPTTPCCDQTISLQGHTNSEPANMPTPFSEPIMSTVENKPMSQWTWPWFKPTSSAPLSSQGGHSSLLANQQWWLCIKGEMLCKARLDMKQND